jgi:basic membrane protein A
MLQIKNPVLPGFNADPSIIRVDDTYYIANSTFEWFPGVRLHESKDLVHWNLLPSALSTTTLLDMNCDVITQHCDTLYPQTLAQERGVYSIGYNSDMSKNAPDACLCSVIWNWSAYYTSAVQSVLDGTWDGSNYYGGMNENLVSITELADFCAAGTKQKVDEAKQQILSGKNGVFDGVIETNTGETVGEQGKTLDAATITGKINWYFKTVHVVE